jgi:peptide/nickel transport system substrate-binding protein
MLLLVLAVAAACAPAAPEKAASTLGEPQQPRPPKVVTVAFGRLVTAVEVFGGGVTGRQSIMPLIHNLVVYERNYQEWVPQLAVEKASVDKGTWQINPDGTMEMTWKFHPNIRWHDGTPFSAEDIVFAVNLRKDPEMASQSGIAQGRLDLIDGISAPDPLTLVTHWSEPYVDADRARSMEPIPRHILQEVYQRDKRAAQTSSYWNADFVGLGPYKVVNWESGIQVELARFDQYFLGMPKLDSVVVKWFNDDNALTGALLAGTVDVATDQSYLSIDNARELERRWQGSTANQVRYDPNGALGHLESQFRPEFARPRNAFTNRLVREGLYRALDRPTLTEVLTDGIPPVADSWYHPSDPMYADLQSAIPQYPYDPSRAQQLLAQAGWVRGADGILVYQQTGERFESEIQAGQGSGPMTWATTVSAQWKAVGADFTQREVPTAIAGGAAREFEATRPGPRMASLSAENFASYRLRTSSIPSESNQWIGQNAGGYSNPRADALFDRIAGAIGSREKIQAHRDAVQEVMGDVGLMPLWWNVTPVVMANGVKGVRTVTIGGTLSSFEWDRD